MELFSHNQQAFEAVISHFNNDKQKAAIVHATGTGKSYIGGAIAENFKNVLVVAPNEYVLDAASAVAKHAECRTYSWVAQQSEMPVGYDLIWFDEFHRMGAETWSLGCTRLIEANPQARIFGSTATEERYLEGRNMADEWFSGDVVSKLSLSDAWVRKVLRVPHYVIGVVSMEDTKADYSAKIKKAKRLNDAQKGKAMAMLDQVILDWSNSYGVPRIIEKHIDKDVERIVVFAQSINRLEEMKSVLPRWFKEAGVKIAGMYIVHSGMGRAEAQKSMNEFETDTRKGVKIMLSVDMLNEGVHVDRVDAVILFRATISKNIYLQQIGRCFSVGQKHQPVILDLADNLTKACGYEGIYLAREKFLAEGNSYSGEFDCMRHDSFDVVDTLKETREVLSMIDRQCADHRSWEEIEAYIDEFYKKNGRLPGRKDDESVYSYLKMHRQQYYIEKYPERIKFLQERGWKMVIKHDEYTYDKAISEIKEILKTKPLPTASNKAMRYLRYLLKSKRATEQQVEEMNSMGIHVIDLQKIWMQRYSEVKEVFDREKSLVPLKKAQRAWIYSQCNSSKLTEEQRDLLETIGAFQLEKAREFKTTEQCVAELKEYVEKNDGFFPTRTENYRLYAYWNNAYLRIPSTWAAIVAAGMGEQCIRPAKMSYLEIIEEFFSKHGRLPVKGEGAYHALKKHTRAMSHEMREYMKEKFGYKTEYEQNFEKNFEEFKAWVIEHGYLPTGKESDSLQRRLAKWMSHMLQSNMDYKNILKDFTENYKYEPKYRVYLVDKIKEDFRRLKDYVTSTGNIPEEGTELMDVMRNIASRRCVKKEYEALFAKFGCGQSKGWIEVTLKMQKVRELYKKNGRLPNTSAEERDLYNTVACCRRWREKGIYQSYVNEIIDMGYDIDKKFVQRSYEEWRKCLIDYLQANKGMRPSPSEVKQTTDFRNFKRLHPEEFDAIIKEYGTGERRNIHIEQVEEELAKYLASHDGKVPNKKENPKLYSRYRNLRRCYPDKFAKLMDAYKNKEE